MFVRTSLPDFLASDPGRLTAVVWERPSDLVTPVLAGLRLFRAGEPAYLLESAESGESVGRFSFLGFGVVDRLELRADEGAAALERLETFVKDHEVNPFVGPPTFPAGCVGYLGYDAIRLMEKIPRRHGTGSTPDVVLIHFRDHLVFDHLRRRVYLVTMVGAGERTEAAFEQAADRLQAMRTTLESGAMSPLRPSATTGPVLATPDAMTYRRQVGIAREYIARGDIFQVVLARQFRRPFDGDAFAVYRSLRAINPSPFQVFFDAGSHQLVGSSPEDLVRIHGDRIETLPIAGTRKRGESPAADQALERELLADPKERAEHTMLVDLARNDIGRVSEPGTVRVDELMKIQRYSHVMHIVSRVSGRLRADSGVVRPMLSCFPAGTVSGAPKIRAMEIIDEQEPFGRGPYAGAVCYFDGRGNLDSCITIRTVVLDGQFATVTAGAGIVADSDASSEEQETVHKASAVLAALEMAGEFT